MKSKSGIKEIVKRVKKGIVNNTAEYLPISVINSIILKNINLADAHIDGLKFEIAKTKEDLEQAFHLLYKAYLAEGFMKKNESELRVTPYHSLPTTCTLIAKYKDEVIATVSIIKSSNFGIPLESAVSVDDIKSKAHQNVAEISALAIRKDYRKESAKVLFPLMKYLYWYAKDYLYVDYMLIGVHPTSFTFYEALFGFQKIESAKVEEYGFVNNASMQAGYMDMNEAQNYLATNFNNFTDESNLYKYMVKLEDDRFEYPDREIKKAFDSVMTKDLFEYFFIQKSDVLKDFSNRQLAILLDIFKELKAIIPHHYVENIENDKNTQFHPRRSYRCSVTFDCRMYFEDGSFRESKIIEAGYGGFAIILDELPNTEDLYAFKIKVGDYKIIDILAKNVSDLKCGIYGFKIYHFNRDWYMSMKELLSAIEGPSAA